MDLLRIIQGSWIGSENSEEEGTGIRPDPAALRTSPDVPGVAVRGPGEDLRALQCPCGPLARRCGRCQALADLAGIAGPSKFVECCCGGLADLVSRAGCARRRGARRGPARSRRAWPDLAAFY